MNDNKTNSSESMDELIAKLKEHASSTDEPATAEREKKDGDDEIRRLLLEQLENGKKTHKSDVPRIDESLSLDEFEEEEEDPVEEIVEDEPVEEEEEAIEQALEENEPVEDEDELIENAEDEILGDDGYLDEDEIFEEELLEEEPFEDIESDDSEETVIEETFIEEGADEDELLVAEESEHTEADEEIEITEEDEDQSTPPVPTPAVFDPLPVFEEQEEEELPDEAQISIDLTEIDAFSPDVEGADDEKYILHAQPDADEMRAASTDTAINGITPDEVLLTTIAAQVDEKTRARLMGIDLSESVTSTDNGDGDEFYEGEEDDSDVITDEQAEDELDVENDVDEEENEEIPVVDPLQMGFDNETSAAAVNGSTSWQTEVDESISDADVEMLLRLGYEQSLRRTIGDARVEGIKQETLNVQVVDASARKPFAYKGREYNGREMTADTQKAYSRDRALMLIRLFSAAVFAFVLLIFDELPLVADVSKSLWALISPFIGSFAYPLIEAAILLLALTPSLPYLLGGIKGALRLEPNIYSIPAISAIIAFANSIGLIFRGVGVIPSLFGGAALVVLLIAVIADLCALRSQELAFSIVSSGKEKFLASDGVYSSDENGTEAQECYNVRRVESVGGYFARTAKYTKASAFLNYLIPVCFAVSIIFGGFGLLKSGSFSTAIRAFVTAYFLLTPSLFALGTTLPLWISNKIISQRGCAVIGPAASEDYSPDTRYGREKKIFFPDGDVLSAAHVKRITLRGDSSSEHYVALAEKLFYVLGGVLRDEGVKADVPPNASGVHIEIAESTEHYLKLYMIDGDETVEVVMGSYDKLTRSGIKLPNENMERVYNDDRRDKLVVYMAFDGQFRIAYSIRYKLSSKFRHTARRLAELGFIPSVETFDPMVTRQLLDELTAEAKLSSRLSISRADHFDSARPRQSCGIVATKSSLNLYYPLISCERIRKSYGDVKRISITLMCVGAAAMTVVLAGEVLMFVRPWMALVWQVLGAGIFALLSAKRVNSGALSLTPPVKKPKQKTDKPNKTKAARKPKSKKVKRAKEK